VQLYTAFEIVQSIGEMLRSLEYNNKIINNWQNIGLFEIIVRLLRKIAQTKNVRPIAGKVNEF
jgi:hypothetical protein